jgi:1-acyl-sn-glycerol-3-phosphate acyltransferase
MDHTGLHQRTRERGVNPLVYWPVRALLQIFFHIYLRMSRIGREYIPDEGPVIIASNHRSFLDPFMIGTMARRPMYYVAKRELFCHPVVTWLLSALGAFPVARGAGDTEMIDTAKEILYRGGIVLMFPEGTRIRPGSLATPKRGVGRLALETGAPVVPVAIIGTEDVRKGWRIRPRKVRIRAGRALRFPLVEQASPSLAGAVTDRIWPCVMLQWEWLGGVPPIRRAAVVGAGTAGTSLAVSLAWAGFEVDLGCRTAEQAAAVAQSRSNDRYLPGVELPEPIRIRPVDELELERHDLVCLAVPASALPAVLEAHGRSIRSSSAVLVLSEGLVAPLGTLPSAYAAEHCAARAVAVLGSPTHAVDLLDRRAPIVLASVDRALRRELSQTLRGAGWQVTASADVTGAELAACASNVAALAAARAASAGREAADAAAHGVLAEVDALARARGASPDQFAGLVRTAAGARSEGQTSEAEESVALLARAAREASVQTPTLEALAALVQGRIEPDQWKVGVIEPTGPRRSSPVRAA